MKKDEGRKEGRKEEWKMKGDEGKRYQGRKMKEGR